MSKTRILRIIGGGKKTIGRSSLDGTRALCGPEAKALEMCSKLNRQKFETIIVYSKRGKLLKEFEAIGIEIEKFDTISKFNILEILYLYHLIKDRKIDILQTHGLRVDFFGFVVAKLAHVPHIIVRHVATSQHLTSGLRKLVYNFFDNFAMNFAAKVVAVSKTIEDDLVATQRIDRSQIVTIVNGVDTKRFFKMSKHIELKIKKDLGVNNRNQVVGMIAQLSYWKGIIYFLKAVPLILKKYAKVVFLIVGDGPEREKLEATVNALGISERVIFAGFRRDVPEVISIMNISVLSSLREGLPNALLESMAMYKPVVATNVGGVAEIVLNDKTGFLVPSGDSSALAGAILKLLNDTTMALRFGEAGRRHIEKNFSLERMIVKYEELYSQIISGTRDQKCALHRTSDNHV